MSRHDWLTIIALFVLTVAALVLPAYAIIRTNQVQLEVTCLNTRLQAETLHAIQQNGIVIRRTARSLGLPVTFPPLFKVPEVPPECA